MNSALPSLALAGTLTLIAGPSTPLHAVGEEVQLSPTPTPDSGERYRPQVEWNSNHREYLTVWHNTWPGGGRDVYARRVDRHGRLRSWFAVASIGRYQPDIAYNPLDDQYLVVWTFDTTGDGSNNEIWGKVIPWNGPGTEDEFAIGAVIGKSAWNPHVVWDSHMSQYMVCWDELGEISGLAESIGCRRVHRSGVPFEYNQVSTVGLPHQSDVAYIPGTGRYLVVWRAENDREPPAPPWDIYGQLIDWATAPIGGRVSLADNNIYSLTEEAANPAVACDDAEPSEAVCWILYELQDPGFPRDSVETAQVAASDLHVLHEGWVFSITFEASVSNPAVAFNAARREFLFLMEVTYSSGGYPYQSIGAVLVHGAYDGDPFFVQDAAFWDHEEPSAAAGDDGDFFVVYSGDDTFTRHIYGRTALTLFFDDFETGNVGRWSDSAP